MEKAGAEFQASAFSTEGDERLVEEVEQTEEVVDGRAVDRHVGIA